jgi:hypothetical protein
MLETELTGPPGFIVGPTAVDDSLVTTAVAVGVAVAGTLMPAVVTVADRAALYWEHSEEPTLMTTGSSDAGQAPMQAITSGVILACAGPHWQATSDGAQPAPVTADEMQGRAQLGRGLRS